MNLDLRTMILMISALSLLFACLLTLVGLHAGKTRGVRKWAMGSLCIGFGLAFSYSQFSLPANPWALVWGAVLILMGTGFQFNGIQAFKTGRCNSYIPGAIAGLAFCQGVWFTIIHPDVHSRVIANSLLFFVINAACAHALFIRIDQPLRTAYWFTGSSFAVASIMFLARAIIVFLSPANTYTLYSQVPLNSTSFFIGSMTQMSIVFGFVLMLNYKLTADHQKLASTDTLTGAMNRRSMEQEANRLLTHCARTGESLAIMMIDVDHFKSINDCYGHLVGDEVLKHLTMMTQNSIRNCDYLARYGGEEFCILLPASLEKDAWKLADRLRQNFATTPIELSGKSLSSTISIGIADSKHTGLNLTSLIVAADQAMYRAKRDGRNQVALYSNHVHT